MDVPDMVGERLGDERATTRVNVGGGDRVYVTATRTLVYRAGGFLSNASIREFSHATDALDVSAGRRQATFAFTYGEDVRGFTVPEERVETLLSGVLSGILLTTGVAGTDESILETYCFTDRTVVVTDARVLVHGGENVWTATYREYAYANIADVRFEQGASTPVVLVTEEGPRRIETPAEQARSVHRTIERAATAYHDQNARENHTPRQRTASTKRSEARTGTETPASATPAPKSSEGTQTRGTRTEPRRAVNETETGEKSTSETAAIRDTREIARSTSEPEASSEVDPADVDGDGTDSMAHSQRNATGEPNTTAPSTPPASEPAGRTDGTDGTDGAGEDPTATQSAFATESRDDADRTADDEFDPGDRTTAPPPEAAAAESGEALGAGNEADGDRPSDWNLGDETSADDGAETDIDRDALVAELDALNETVAHQRDLIERQHTRIERLSEALNTE